MRIFLCPPTSNTEILAAKGVATSTYVKEKYLFKDIIGISFASNKFFYISSRGDAASKNIKIYRLIYE